MRLLPDERAEVPGVAARWKAQYYRPLNDTWNHIRSGPAEISGEVVYDQLRALPVDATAADVAAIIGNDGWVGEACTECQGRAIVLVGEERDYESHTVFLCAACVTRVADLVAQPPSTNAIDPSAQLSGTPTPRVERSS